jgi:acylphosphatase
MTRFIVRGQVQGVGFRWATRNQARRLNLLGWVRNLSDGSVEILAMGERSELFSFSEWLWQGPEGSKVKGVKMTFEETQNPPNIFCIR